LYRRWSASRDDEIEGLIGPDPVPERLQDVGLNEEHGRPGFALHAAVDLDQVVVEIRGLTDLLEADPPDAYDRIARRECGLNDGNVELDVGRAYQRLPDLKACETAGPDCRRMS
jgi:hypothetical protein